MKLIMIAILIFALLWTLAAPVYAQSESKEPSFMTQYIVGSLGSLASAVAGSYLGLLIEGKLPPERKPARHPQDDHWHMFKSNTEPVIYSNVCDTFIAHMGCDTILGLGGMTVGAVAIVASIRSNDRLSNNLLGGMFGASVGLLGTFSSMFFIDALGYNSFIFIYIWPLVIFTLPTLGAMYGLQFGEAANEMAEKSGQGFEVIVPLFELKF